MEVFMGKSSLNGDGNGKNTWEHHRNIWRKTLLNGDLELGDFPSMIHQG